MKRFNPPIQSSLEILTHEPATQRSRSGSEIVDHRTMLAVVRCAQLTNQPVRRPQVTLNSRLSRANRALAELGWTTVTR